MHEEKHLQEHGIRLTAVRLLVWRTIMQLSSRPSSSGVNDGAFCLNDIEAECPSLEKSSIFRTLRLFSAHHLLHEIDDGSGFCKYCVCRCEDHEHHVSHVHFTCTRCGKTFCITNQLIPQVSLPAEFLAQEAEYVIKGICPNCRR